MAKIIRFTGDMSSDTRALKQIDDRNFDLTVKRAAKLQ